MRADHIALYTINMFVYRLLLKDNYKLSFVFYSFMDLILFLKHNLQRFYKILEMLNDCIYMHSIAQLLKYLI